MLRKCRECGTMNRVPAARLVDRGRCGSCRAPLPPAAEPLDVGPAELDEIVASASVPVLVDFWADWCAPCRMTAPEVAKAAAAMAGRALVLKVDTERHPELAARFGVRGIPNFVVFKQGAPVGQHAGAVDHRQLEAWLAEASAS